MYIVFVRNGSFN